MSTDSNRAARAEAVRADMSEDRRLDDLERLHGPSAGTRRMANAPAPTLRQIRLTPVSGVTMSTVRWLWKHRLAVGTFTLLGGREGIGKTLLSDMLAAELTRGELPGEFYGTPRNVIIAASEDSWSHTIAPRLKVAGADLSRVFRVEVMTETGHALPLMLPLDLSAWADAAQELHPALTIIDPLISRLDSKLDTHKDAEVRVALEPLATVADAAAMTVLGLIHVNKTKSTDPLTTLMGSRAFVAVARAVLFVMADPDDATVRLVGQPKNNLGRTDLPTLRFTVSEALAGHSETGEDVWSARIDWAGESATTIQDALDAAHNSGDRTAVMEAADWLYDFLSTQPDGSAASADIKREGSRVGHSVNALKRARPKLNVSAASRGFPRQTYWALPVGSTSRPTSTTGPTGPTGPTTTSVSPVGPVRESPPAREDDHDYERI